MREEQTKTTTERLIFHVDVNSAFLSWESVRRIKEGLPDLRDIPACIGGDPTKRTGIVVAKSIPAKKCGVQNGDRKSTRLNSSHTRPSRMPSSA